MRRARFLSLRPLYVLLGAFVLASLVRFFIVRPFIVSGFSMQPTFSAGDYLVIDLLSYRFEKPARNDIIVFHYPFDPALYYVKRIDALPGEVVDENTGAILSPTSTSTNVLTLASDEYFVLGDNAKESSDSREWGPLQKKFIVGRVVARAWPL